jgi:dihydrofolate reductase
MSYLQLPREAESGKGALCHGTFLKTWYAAAPARCFLRRFLTPDAHRAVQALFKDLTTRTTTPGMKNAVIMGRKTWASIPAKFRPLPNRVNVVLSRSADVRVLEGIPDEVLVSPSLEAAVTLLSNPPYAAIVENIFVIGGAAAFEEALSGTGPVACRTVYLTRVHTEVDCDVFVKPIDDTVYALADFKVRAMGKAWGHEALERRGIPPAGSPAVRGPFLWGTYNGPSLARCFCTYSQPRQSEKSIEFQFCTYRNRSLCHLERGIRPEGGAPPDRHEEYQYLDAIR